MATAASLPVRGPVRTLVLADVLPGARVRDAALVTGAALLTALLAQVSIPVAGSPVPITGQTLAVVLTAAALGPARGLAGQGLYLLLGAVGLPFYSDASGGFDVLTGATGGYLVGFLPAAYLIGLAARQGHDRRITRALPLFALGQLVIFAVGVPWLAAGHSPRRGRGGQRGLHPVRRGRDRQGRPGRGRAAGRLVAGAEGRPAGLIATLAASITPHGGTLPPVAPLTRRLAMGIAADAAHSDNNSVGLLCVLLLNLVL